MFQRLIQIIPTVSVIVGMGLLSGAQPAQADDCVALGGTVVAGECRISGPVTKSGAYSIATPLRITSTGNVVVPALGPGLGNALTLNVTGNVTLEAPLAGQVAIDGNAGG